MKRILITGAAGRVGGALRPYLREHYRLRLFDRVVPAVPASDGEELMLGDLVEYGDVRDALDGVDAVVHLACVHGLDLDFEMSLDANYRALLFLLEESARRGIDRFVYASSHHVMGAHRRESFAGETEPLAPDAFYGLSKAFGELACAMYAHRYGLRTLVIRIGNADLTVTDDRTLRMWVSSRDLASLVRIGLENDTIEYDIVYGTSLCPDPLFDNARAFELGYKPQDRTEEHLDPDFTVYEAMPPRLGRDWVGGAYAVAPLPPLKERP